MSDHHDDKLKAQKGDANAISSSFKPIVNVACPSGGGTQQQSNDRACLPTELVKNGGFEQEGVLTAFADWNESTELFEIQSSEISYEGNFSARFMSVTTPERQTKSALISQNVTVTPGCFLVLSFAANYRNLGLGAIENPKVRARVFYLDSNPVDLINIEIDYHDELMDKGFVFHQKVANVPVPSNISTVTVEFFITTEDIGDEQNDNQTVWLLDGVSLRTV